VKLAKVSLSTHLSILCPPPLSIRISLLCPLPISFVVFSLFTPTFAFLTSVAFLLGDIGRIPLMGSELLGSVRDAAGIFYNNTHALTCYDTAGSANEETLRDGLLLDYLPLFYLSVCLSICLSISLSVCLSVYLSVCLSVCLSVYLSVCLVYAPFFTSSCLSYGTLSALFPNFLYLRSQITELTGTFWDYLFCAGMIQPFSRNGKTDMFWCV
jgi:hypothetical protein